MKSRLLIIIGIIALFTFVFDDAVYGLWMPQSPEDLMEQSNMIFVGNVTSVNVIEFEKSSTYIATIDEIDQEVVKNYTLSLDEYTVDIEEFIKNPQDANTITVRQPTISLPGRVTGHTGFALGDRVLFYLSNHYEDGNTYGPESFLIPEQCDASSVVNEPRMIGSDFKMMQHGMEKQDNFTANSPITFIAQNDMGTLFGASLEYDVSISKQVGKIYKDIVFHEKITVDAKPCEWLSTAKWELTPDSGNYLLNGRVYEEDSNSPIGNKQFVVLPQSPLKLDDFASELWYDHELIIDGTILDITGFGKEERTYDIKIDDYFKPSEGKNFGVITVYGFTPFESSKGDRGIFFIKKEDAQWKHGRYGTKITGECHPELMYHNPPLIDTPLVRGQPPIDFSNLIDCYPYYYKKYLPQYMKERGATEFSSPRTQSIDGVPPDEVVCNEGLHLLLKPTKFLIPVCVTESTYHELANRGWSIVLEWGG